MFTQYSNQMAVFLGDELSISSERQFLERLRRGVPDALVLANFYPRRVRHPRQIDFFIHTDCRTVHVELKALDEARPLQGGPNGHWTQRGAMDAGHSIGNPFRQANDGTYAISDSMRIFRQELAGVPEASKTSFETVVCLFPTIPRHSQIDTFRYVSVVDYADLVEMLTTPGRRVGWDPTHWDSFLRFQEVYRERDNSLQAEGRRHAKAGVDEYRDRFSAALSEGLHAWVTTPATLDGTPVHALEAATSVTDGDTVALVGPSGFGKTHTALHAAVSRTASGSTVIWARANEYEPGALSRALTRASAPYTTDSSLALIEKTLLCGHDVMVVVDGLTGDPAEQRLFDQLAAMRLRHRFALLLTATASVPVERLVGRTVLLGEPDDESRQVLLDSYGLADAAGLPALTPFEIAILAAVADGVPDGASRAEIQGAFIGRYAKTERTRAGLRQVAMHLVANMAGSIGFREVRAALTRSGMNPTDIDAVLEAGLLVSTAGRMRFTHERHAEFLAAEYLVLASSSGAELGASLADARFARLASDVVGLELDETRISDALSEVSDPSLYAKAAAGEYGAVAQSVARAEIAEALAEAIVELSISSPEFRHAASEDAWLGGAWIGERQWTMREKALLDAAAMRLMAGDFVDDIATLLDRTDEVCAATIQRLVEQGSRVAITTVVAATYAHPTAPSMNELAATAIARVVSHPVTATERDRDAASRLFAGATRRSWGRLYIALQLCRWGEDASDLPELVAMAWKSGGFHLRLEALSAAEAQLGRLDEAGQEKLVDFLESVQIDPGDWALSSALVEALSAAGRIEPISTLDDIISEINEVLTDPDDPDLQQKAASIYSSQFENDVVGPYYEAVAQLYPQHRQMLLLMAASADYCFWRASILAELAKDLSNENPRLVDLFRRWASELPDLRGGLVSENVAVFLSAVRGWAKISTTPPALDPGDDRRARAWTLVGGLLFTAVRADAAIDSAELWDEVMKSCPAEAIDALRWSHSGLLHHGELTAVAQIAEAFPTEFVRLARWGVLHRDELAAAASWPDHDQAGWGFAVRALGTYGREESVELLRGYVDDRELGGAAVAAIRELKARFDRSM